MIHFTTRSRGGGKHAKETQPEGVKHKIKKKTPYQSPPLDSLTIAVGSFLLSNGDLAPIGGSFCLSGVRIFTIPPCDYDALTTSKQALVPHELALPRTFFCRAMRLISRPRTREETVFC